MPDVNAIMSEATSGLSLGALTLTGILRVVFIVLVGIAMMRLFNGIVSRALEHARIDTTLRGYIRSVVKVGLWFLLALIVADSVGIKVTSLVALMSIVGVAVSLALQNTLSNLAGGIMLLVTKPVEVGDFVELNGVNGTVKSVGLAYTNVVTCDHKDIFIPNSEIASTKIINYNHLGKRRVDWTFSASYDAPTQTVKTAIGEVLGQYPQIHGDPAPVIYLTNYGASSIDYVARVWVDSGDYWDVYYGVLEGVRESFDRHGIEMTYDHLNVHVLEK